MHFRVKSKDRKKDFFGLLLSSYSGIKLRGSAGHTSIPAIAIPEFTDPPKFLPSDFLACSFNGQDPGKSDCDVFIRRIRFRAIAEGKEGDPKSMAELASRALEGSASDWYEMLDDQTKGDWDLLKPAMLRRYPKFRPSTTAIFTPPVPPPRSLTGFSSSANPSNLRPQESHNTSRPERSEPCFDPTIPTPAGAPVCTITPLPVPLIPSDPNMPVPAAPPTVPIVELVAAMGTGLLRIVPFYNANINGKPPVYLSRSLSTLGWHVMCRTSEEALQVRFVPNRGEGHHSLRLINSSLSDYPWLGMQCVTNFGASPLTSEFSAYLIGASDPDPSSLKASTPRFFVGPARVEIWDIQLDGTLEAVWAAGDEITYPLTLAVFESGRSLAASNTVFLVKDYDAFIAARSSETFYKARIVFEPVPAVIAEPKSLN